MASKLKTPLNTRLPHANHLLPHRSKTTVKNVSAGSSVEAATANVMKTSKPRDPTFRTWPSKTLKGKSVKKGGFSGFQT